MHLFREATPPGAVTHSTVATFGSHEYLIVIRGSSYLSIYLMDTLDWISEFKLDGKVTHIKTLPRDSEYEDDSIVIAFEIAKLAILKWKPEERILATQSIHFYEREVSLDHFSDTKFTTRLTVDPNRNCISYLFQRDCLAMLPLIKDIDEEVTDKDKTTRQFESSIILGSSELDMTCVNIVDMAYLYGYRDPTLAVLYRQPRSWTGLLPKICDNTGFMALSIDLDRRISMPVVQSVGLPWNLSTIVPLGKPLGGCLLMGPSELIYVSSTGQFSQVTIEDGFEGAVAAHVPDSQYVILALKENGLRLLTISNEGLLISTLDMRKGFKLPTTLSVVSGHIFIGCKGDSPILRYSLEKVSKAIPTELGEDEAYADSSQEELNFTFDEGPVLKGVGPISAVISPEPHVLIAASRDLLYVWTHAIDIAEGSHRLEARRRRPNKLWLVAGNLIVTDESSTTVYKSPQFVKPIHTQDFLHDQPTLAVSEVEDGILVVQRYSVALVSYDWNLIEKADLNECCIFAEIKKNRLLLVYEGEALRYLEVRQQRLNWLDVPIQDTSVCALSEQGWMVGAKGSQISIAENGESHNFSMSGLPSHPSEAMQIDDDIPIDAIYTLKVGTVNYVGILMDSSFVIYARISPVTLVKEFTVPFVVRRAPVPVEWCGMNAFFIPGKKPYLIIRGPYSAWRCILVDAAVHRVLDITAERNELAYLDSQGRIYVSKLPSVDITRADIPCRVVDVSGKITALAYHNKTGYLVVGTEEGQIYVYDDSWREIQMVQLSEAILSLVCTNLDVAGYGVQYREVLVIGTAIFLDKGDAAPLNGNIHVASMSKQASPNVLRLRSAFSVHGAVSGLCSVMGRLVASHGRHLLTYKLKDHFELEPIAFLDTDGSTQSLKSIRNLLFVGDRIQGSKLVFYGTDQQRLETLSKSSLKIPIASAEIVSSSVREDLYIVVSDLIGRFHLLQFDPESPQSEGGTNLILRAVAFTGQVASTMTMLEREDSDLIAVGGTEDGSIIAVEPVEEDAFRTLFVVTQQMMDKEQPVACLNSRMHRSLHAEHGTAQPLIDLDYAKKFWALDVRRQLQYSRKLGRYGLNHVRFALMSAQYGILED